MLTFVSTVLQFPAVNAGQRNTKHTNMNTPKKSDERNILLGMLCWLLTIPGMACIVYVYTRSKTKDPYMLTDHEYKLGQDAELLTSVGLDVVIQLLLGVTLAYTTYRLYKKGASLMGIQTD